MKKFIATVLILASAPAFAAGTVSAPKSFTRDGVTYTYTVAEAGGRYLIKGSDSLGKPFKLSVAGKRVRGTYASSDVGFTREISASGNAAGSK